MKNKALIIAVVTSFILIGTAFMINYLTSWAHPWFVYPAFGLLWWPISVLLARKPKTFSVVGGLYIAGFAYLVNLITSPNFPWFAFIAFGVLWWPISVLLGRKPKVFSIVGGLYITGFAYFANMVTSPNFPWFIFVAFGTLWWPLGVILGTARKPKLFSIVASLYIIGFLYLTNIITSPNVLWFIFPAFGVLWWPLSVIICGAKRYKLYAIVSVLYITAFLGLINYMFSPNYMWFYYPVYGLLWWPLSMFLARKPKIYSIVMSFITIGFLALINYMNSPDTVWWMYTALPILFWPIVMLLGKKANTLGFAIIGALGIIGYYFLLYSYLTLGAHPWYLYIVLPVLWWPVCYAVGLKRTSSLWFQFISIAVFLAYYIALNLILTPQHFWSINLIYPLLWAAMGIYFGNNKKFFAFSVCAAIVTIAYFSILNYIVSPNVIWAVYPSFAILWWPLSMYFFRVRDKKPKKVIE